MDREKRRKFIRKIVKFWFEHNLAIAIGLVVFVIGVVIAVLYFSLRPAEQENNDDIVFDQNYSDVFDTDDSGNVAKKTKRVIKTTESGETVVEEEDYPTLLEYNADTKSGYMNNCIFLGDSRTVAMVSYGFVSDENVLAQVGISHTAVLNNTFTQNSGKQYTIAQYLSSHQAPVIYIGYGVNGMNGLSSEKYEKSYKEVVEKIMELAPNSNIVLMAIWPVDDYGRYKGNVKNEWIEKYNEFLYTLAEYEGIYYLDVDKTLKGSDGQIKPEYDAGDGLHYKSCAYTAILEYIIHHPVKGVSDDGEFVVKYVKPSGDFKKMQIDTTELPANVQVVDDLSQLITPTPEYDPVWLVTPTPSPTIKAEKNDNVGQQQEMVLITPSPSPTIKVTPSPTVTVAVNEPQNQVTPEVNVPTVVPTDPPTPTPEPTEEPTPEPTEEPTPEPQQEPTPEPQPDANPETQE